MITEVSMPDIIDLAEKMFTIRNDEGFIPFIANKWQRKYDKNHSRNGNLIIKQRGRGISTWALMRQLLNTISNKNTTSLVMGLPDTHVELAQHMVLSFYTLGHAALPRITDCQPGFIEFGSICSSILFGPPDEHLWRGRYIQNVHCLEVGMWDEKQIRQMFELKLRMRDQRKLPAYDFVIEMTSGTEWNLNGDIMDLVLDGMQAHFLSFL